MFADYHASNTDLGAFTVRRIELMLTLLQNKEMRVTTSQEPIGSGFGATSTAADVVTGVELSSKTAIVTGGYSGIGVETVRALRSAGAEVVVPTRDRGRAVAALSEIDGVEVQR